MAASALRHYTSGAVIHHYYDHRTQQHRRQVLSQEEMLLRYISHIPSRHFKMVRYYGFLSNSKSGELLPKIYAALEMEVKTKPTKPGYATLMKQFTNVDPYQCMLCGDRMVFSTRAEGLLAQRREKLEKKRWLLAA
ncbi:transposase (plasmid) [Hafnia alvei]|nr:transposase [Hafnia alvei]WNN54740.1 transposase [Hafnia alvei]